MVKTLLPDAEVIDPSTAFASTAHWLTEWPALVRSLDAVIAVAADDRTVGAGVARELFDAEAVGAPTAVLVDAALRVWRGVALLPPTCRTPGRVGYLVAGRRLAASSVLSVPAASTSPARSAKP
jgi:hypothetical protein